MDKEKRKKIIDRVFKIVLIVIIILLLLRNCQLLKDKDKDKNPTGNVDIIEINCDRDDTCDISPVVVDDNGKKTDNTPGGSANPDGDGDGDGLIVYDNDVTWHGDTVARIFTNSMYGIEDVIAPESHNTYQFVVKNGTNYNLKYTIKFIENNPYHINMKYKLKKNDTYIVDHYVSASELAITNALLNTGSNDTYYLEWKWISSSNDTEIGANPDSKYELKITVEAESTNG